MTLDPSAAVEIAKKSILSGLRPEMAQHESGEFTLMALGVNMLRNKTTELLEWAEREARGFDALTLGIAGLIERKEEIPPAALDWLTKYLRKEVARPKAQAGRKDEFWLHFLIWISINHLIDLGFKATRNDEIETISACDIVAQALCEIGREPTTFSGVKRVWLRMQKRRGTTVPAT